MTSPSLGRKRPRTFDGTSPAEVAIFGAMEKLLAERPLQEITVAQILRGASLSRANFYHYFASKYDVVVAMLSRLFTDVYAEAPPWESSPGKGRARRMGTSLKSTLELWSRHGDVICAAVEHMHSVPEVGAAWAATYDRFVESVAEQIEFERAAGRAPAGAPAQLLAAVLVCGVERVFYVGSRGLDPSLPTPEAAVESLVSMNSAVIYGHQQPAEADAPRVDPPGPEAVMVADGERSSNATAEAILAAIGELLQERSLDELSVADILERSNASRATFYFYFGSKDEAFIALFKSAGRHLVEGMRRLSLAGKVDLEGISGLVDQWLDLDARTMAVVRNAVHEWSKRPELRTEYLAVMTEMESLLRRMVHTDRASGAAAPGPPAEQYAATLLWTIERAVAGALAGSRHLEDIDQVKSVLGYLLYASIYGR